jgi:ATP-dependent helicase YprA (DUF1998 family)
LVSVAEAIESIGKRHIEFLESTYHISNERIIKERKRLMDEGTIFTEPWIEGTPRYKHGGEFEELEVENSVKSVLKELQKSGLAYPPYAHQFKSLDSFFSKNKNLVVSTGTGSGKTEIFILSLIGMLAKEASRNKSNKMRAVRAIILYPMNALVSDQLARVRKLFGSKSGSQIIRGMFGRIVQFGMYTSRTPYHGVYDTKKNDKKIKPIIDYFVKLSKENQNLYEDLIDKGRIPTKNLEGFRSGKSPDNRYKTQPGDTELYTRQEMLFPNENGGVPDLLITNYSMLEYMLLRPIEQPFFDSTKQWLNADQENQLLIVIDEAHLYRGAQGAEVAMLVRRLLNHLNIGSDRVRFILSSASLGDPEKLRDIGAVFGSSLTGAASSSFEVITGERMQLQSGADISSKLDIECLRSHKNEPDEVVKDIFNHLEWEFDYSSGDADMANRLRGKLINEKLFHILYNNITGQPMNLVSLSKILFPEADISDSKNATMNLLLLSSMATLEDGGKLLPSRIHMIYKGLPKLYICINPNCTARRAKEDNIKLLGKMYTEPRFQCECGARVFELLTDRNCGSAYIKAYRKHQDQSLDMVFLWDEIQTGTSNTNSVSHEYDELHILIEQPKAVRNKIKEGMSSGFDTIPKSFLNIFTGHITEIPDKQDDSNFIPVWVPQEVTDVESQLWSWKKCPACGRGTGKQNKEGTIMDLETKGEEPFANIIKELFLIQPPNLKKQDLPNQGRKVLCFSDGRQKAARLARDLQRSVERDSFREMIIEIIKNYPEMTLNALYPIFIILSHKYNIGFFDDEDAKDSFEGSRTLLNDSKNQLNDIAKQFNETTDELIIDEDFYNQVNENGSRPPQYNRALLRALGDKYYSMRSLLIAYVEPSNSVFEAIKKANEGINPKILRELLLYIIQNALSERAYDKAGISDLDRELSRQTINNPTGWQRKEGEGLEENELIPKNILKLIDSKLTAEQIKSFKRSLIKSSKDCNGMRVENLLETNHKQKSFLNPKAVMLHPALFDNWYRCRDCHDFTPTGINGKCEHCGGEIEKVPLDDMHFLARKEFFREPCKDIFNGKRKPFTLRSEEHSAQLSSKDVSDIFSRSEMYELLFQDIMISENRNDQPVDILSSTTTMEVGIDIGSLTGVGMRTIPPLPANYQQRAGRAGRRGASLSTIVTYADNSPFETFNFKHPERLIGAQNAEPIIYINNKKIIERHINATLIQKFFHKAPIPQTANVFSSLGTAFNFFKRDSDYSFRKFEEWVKNEILSNHSEITAKIATMIPDGLDGNDSQDLNWKEAYIMSIAQNFISSLRNLSESNYWDSTSGDDYNLLSSLLDNALLPTFSFPIDVCNFAVFDSAQHSNRMKIQYEITQDLKQALSEYVPSRQVVVDKKTYTSYGLYFPFATDTINRAKEVEWNSLKWLNYCTRCKTILKEDNVNLSEKNERCIISSCGAPIKSLRIYKPEGFSPEVRDRKAVEGEKSEGDRIYAQPAKLPLSSQDNEDIGITKSFGMKHGIAYYSRNKELDIVNFGPKEEGFMVCTKCGAIGDADKLSKPHNRPYPIYEKGQRLSNQCPGSSPIATSFGFSFNSDITVLKMKFTDGLSFAYNEPWFEAACKSFSEALVIGATRTLIIDPKELSGNYQILGPTAEDISKGIDGYVEFFLYDTTSGGAGFSVNVFEKFEEVLKTTKDLLSECECEQSCPSCLRTYTNRIYHEKLDRHLALDLFNYLVDGSLPVPSNSRAKIFLNRLDKTLNLMNSDLKTDIPNEALNFNVKLNGTEVKVILKSCMIQNQLTDNFVVYASDFELMHSLPTIAGQIISRFV